MNEEAERLARDFAAKCNVCTHAGIYNLAIPVFTQLCEAIALLKKYQQSDSATEITYKGTRMTVLSLEAAERVEVERRRSR